MKNEVHAPSQEQRLQMFQQDVQHIPQEKITVLALADHCMGVDQSAFRPIISCVKPNLD